MCLSVEVAAAGCQRAPARSSLGGLQVQQMSACSTTMMMSRLCSALVVDCLYPADTAAAAVAAVAAAGEAAGVTGMSAAAAAAAVDPDSD